MKNTITLLLATASAVLLAACTTVPKVAALGSYFQIFMNEEPIVEYSYKTSSQCEKVANSVFLSSSQDTQKAISSGTMRLACSGQSQSNKLPYTAKLVTIMTDEKYDARFKSIAACRSTSARIKGDVEKIVCE